ncbi:tetratricopeptide repeat protein [Actinomadura sp. NPDC023710]|uniref:tetratricopeptide repeat protein n=1 Tax=Actinomadura sp. NPDC023710 TaxID=3158219 RepID=UPI0033C55E7F
MPDDGTWDRRSLLRGAAVVAGAAAAAPLLGGTARADAVGDADALFKAGKFEQAGRAYEEILKKDPANLHAARRRGYVGLLSNRFPEAENYLTMALKLAPDDKETNSLLGDCYIRQDKFALSAPRWEAAGEDAYAKWFAAVGGDAYEIHGDVARVPWRQVDPEPQIEVSVNGGPPKLFSFYTGAGWLGMSADVAREAGLRPVHKVRSDFEGHIMWSYYGVLESFKLGDIELRNIPVNWSEPESPDDAPVRTNDGLIGTWVFYHLLTTFDYASGALILRRPTSEAAGKVRADARRAGAEPLPLWLAREHMCHSRGTFTGDAGAGTGVVGVNLGGVGEIVAGMSGETAKQLGIRTDGDRPIETFGHSQPTVTYPCYPKEVRLGDAAANDVYCESDPNMPVNVPWPFGPGFDAIGHFAHCFYKPYNVTLDFTGMNLYIARGKAA